MATATMTYETWIRRYADRIAEYGPALCASHAGVPRSYVVRFRKAMQELRANGRAVAAVLAEGTVA